MDPVPDGDAATGVSDTQALDDATIDTVLDALLRADPMPQFMAAADTGLCIPMPSEAPIPPDCILTGIGSALELIIPADFDFVIEAWQRVRSARGAQASVRLRQDPERAITLHFIDARHRYGVYLGVFIGMRGSIPKFTAPELFRPRFCCLQRNEVSVISSIDAALTKILGWEAAELIGMKSLELCHPDDRPVAIANWMEMLSRPGADQRVLLRYRHRDGNYIWFEVTNRNLIGDPAYGHVLTEMVDVSERMDAIEALRASEQLLRRLTEALPLGVVQIDTERRIVYNNEPLLSTVGVAEAQSLDSLLQHVVPHDRPALGAALDALLSVGTAADLELSIGSEGSRRCSLGMRALSAENGKVTGAIICIADVTERVRLREELERRAKYDTLTRCQNRASILETLASAVYQHIGSGPGMAVLFIDLNRFKEVNDRYGHAAGDELLRLTGQRLLAAVRYGDVVGRLGGDEFLVVCPEVASPTRALDIANRIAASLAQTVTLGGSPIVPGSSIGVAWTDRPIDCDAIVAIADEAMYEAKRSAGGPVLAMR